VLLSLEDPGRIEREFDGVAVKVQRTADRQTDMVKRPQQQRHHGGGGCGIWTDRAGRGVSRVGKRCQLVGSATNIRQQTVIRARSLQDHDPGHHHLIVEEGKKPIIRAHVWRPARCEKETFFDMQLTGMVRPIGRIG
jgi:hypothetical protein